MKSTRANDTQAKPTQSETTIQDLATATLTKHPSMQPDELVRRASTHVIPQDVDTLRPPVAFDLHCDVCQRLVRALLYSFRVRAHQSLHETWS